jgi:hypothetical protein
MWSLETSAKNHNGVERGKARIGRARRMPPKVRLNRGRRGCLHNSSSNYRDRGSRWTSLLLKVETLAEWMTIQQAQRVHLYYNRYVIIHPRGQRINCRSAALTHVSGIGFT